MNKPTDNPFLQLMRRYQSDPVAFATEVIGVEPDVWQSELLMSVADPERRRITVRSGHGVGKSTAVAMAAVWHVLMRVPSKTVVTAPTSAQRCDRRGSGQSRIASAVMPFPARVLS